MNTSALLSFESVICSLLNALQTYKWMEGKSFFRDDCEIRCESFVIEVKEIG